MAERLLQIKKSYVVEAVADGIVYASAEAEDGLKAHEELFDKLTILTIENGAQIKGELTFRGKFVTKRPPLNSKVQNLRSLSATI